MIGKRRRMLTLIPATILLGTMAVSLMSAGTAASPPQVAIDTGRVEGTADDGLHVFKGIPYAAPPVGELRWRAPQPVAKWSGVRQATAYGHDSPQKLSLDQSEDCLYLNVWAPADAAGRPYPVMVWIHGGGFIQGSGRLNGETLAKRGVVLVSINYRLGRLGSFAHPALLKQVPEGEPPANFWLLDQIAALKWVQRNIAQFGGDPDRVTTFGVSAGGTSVNVLMASPLAKGLFRRAIAQSGMGGFGPYRRLSEPHRGREPMTTDGENFAAAQQLAGNPDVLSALRALPAKTVIDDRGGFDIVVDGVSLTDDLQAIFEQGKQNPVPFITGANSFEGNLSLAIPWTDQPPKAEVTKVLDQLAPHYGRKPDDKDLWADLYGDVFFRTSAMHLARQMERAGAAGWNYHFDYVRGRGRNSRGAGHGSEVGFVMATVLQPGARDREIIAAMQGHWIQFAKTGDPNGPGLPDWPQHTAASAMTLVYGQDRIHAVRDLDKARFDILLAAMERSWSDAAVASKTTTAAPTKPAALSPESDKALRERVNALTNALIAGDVNKCLDLSDPAVVQEKGRDTAEKFWRGVSSLTRLAKAKASDRVIKSIEPLDDGKAVRVEIELTLNGKKQPSGFEIWGLVDGKWYYRETAKQP